MGHYPYLSVIFSVTLALFVIGVFGALLIHTNKLKKIIQENIEFQVYLDKTVSESQRIRIHKAISDKSYVAKKEDVAQITLITKEDAARDFSSATGEDFVSFLGDNPLRDLFTVNVASQTQDSITLDNIKIEIEAITGVYEVAYVDDLLSDINANIAKISLILMGFAGILILVVIILINNTVKLALFSQRFLIRSMQLVGATGLFIKTPFLWRSIVHGIIAGLISSALLIGIVNYAYSEIDDLDSLANTEMLFALSGGLIALGTVLCFFSSLRAINKYLKMSLDELY